MYKVRGMEKFSRSYSETHFMIFEKMRRKADETLNERKSVAEGETRWENILHDNSIPT